jgi:hypothetical protein
MRLSHSIPMTLLVSMAALVSACGDDPAEDSTPNTGGTSSGGTATGGTAGAGAGTSGAGGAGTGGSAGSGTSGSGGSGGSGVVDYPTDSSQAGIEAFLAMETYKAAGMGWRPETMASAGTANPHLANKRYFNETIIASKAAGNKPPSMGQHVAGSMSVKELLDGTTVIGKAATLRTGSMNIFYCVASVDGRCGTGSTANVAFYGSTPGGSCSCHGSGTNISHDVIPLPLP